MKIIKITFFIVLIMSLTSCASGYKMINPSSINYVSTNEVEGVKLEYKYNLLEKKYAKKEIKKGVRLVAIKITNNSEKNITFGKDVTLTYENDSEVYVLENENTFRTLKQSPASYLWYLLLTPLSFNVTEVSSNGRIENSSTPIGLVVGPGLTAGNMIAAGAANNKFKTEMLNYNINGSIIKKGETKHGLIGVRADSYDALKLKVE